MRARRADVQSSTASVRWAKLAQVTAVTGSIVFKRDGGTPSATAGMQADPGDIITLNSRAELDNFRAVRQHGTDATIDVEYFP